MQKRQFIKDLVLTGIAMPLGLGGMSKAFASKVEKSPLVFAEDNTFWEQIRQQYILKPDYINLENGYYNFLPQPILNKYIEHIKEINYQGSYYMRTVQWENKQKSVIALAAIAGCTPEELIITRNTTESLDTIIGGIHWQAGDEAIMAEQDYGAMLDMFKLVSE
jgi:selenocysteine lyase/cysteine desulfurase